jgi:hypothetical protein
VTHDILHPRPDVLAATLSDAVFAGQPRLGRSRIGAGCYGDPDVVFAATHPSQGLRDLVTTLGRLTGAYPDAPPVIGLELAEFRRTFT